MLIDEVRFKSEWKHGLQMLFSSSPILAEPGKLKGLFSVSLTISEVEASCSVSGLARSSLLFRDTWTLGWLGSGEESLSLDFLPCSGATPIATQNPSIRSANPPRFLWSPGLSAGNAGNNQTCFLAIQYLLFSGKATPHTVRILCEKCPGAWGRESWGSHGDDT